MAGLYNDLHRFDTARLVWTDLSSVAWNAASAPPPAPRSTRLPTTPC
jgi:hypothetical protein